jgi:hypothetical protein
MSENQSSSSYSQVQALNYANESSIKIRLDVSNLLKDIELDLRGKMITYSQDENTGRIEKIEVTVGDPKANDKGVQTIMKCVKSIINVASIQGNLEKDQYQDFLYQLNLDLNELIFVNMFKFGISDEDYKGIIDDILNLAFLVISRTIDNKERESYSQTVKHTENQTIDNRRGLLPI